MKVFHKFVELDAAYTGLNHHFLRHAEDFLGISPQRICGMAFCNSQRGYLYPDRLPPQNGPMEMRGRMKGSRATQRGGAFGLKKEQGHADGHARPCPPPVLYSSHFCAQIMSACSWILETQLALPTWLSRLARPVPSMRSGLSQTPPPARKPHKNSRSFCTARSSQHGFYLARRHGPVSLVTSHAVGERA